MLQDLEGSDLRDQTVEIRGAENETEMNFCEDGQAGVITFFCNKYTQ